MDIIPALGLLLYKASGVLAVLLFFLAAVSKRGSGLWYWSIVLAVMLYVIYLGKVFS